MALLIVQLEDSDRKRCKRVGVTHSKAPGVEPRVEPGSAAHGTRTLPTKPSGTPAFSMLTG